MGLALLALAGSGQLGNFGHVGVDQVIFGPGVFFWFFVIGAVTVVMAGGISRRPAPVTRPAPDAPAAEDPDESDLEAAGAEPELELEPAADTGAESEPDREPSPPPPPVKPAPDCEDVEDLMFVDADIETDGAAPPAGSG